jgi:hypothetical protein
MRIHNYSGKEQGTMLIGTATELQELCKELVFKLNGFPDKSPDAWPPHLLTRAAHGVEEGNRSDFYFSIHLETQAGDKPKPSLRSRFGLPLFLLALVGIWQIITWLRTLVA